MGEVSEWFWLVLEQTWPDLGRLATWLRSSRVVRNTQRCRTCHYDGLKNFMVEERRAYSLNQSRIRTDQEEI